jgi:hypothetical protein
MVGSGMQEPGDVFELGVEFERANEIAVARSGFQLVRGKFGGDEGFTGPKCRPV